MTAAKKYLLDVLRCYINGIDVSAPGEDVDISELISLCRSNQVGAVCYVMLRRHLGEKDIAPLRNDFGQAVFESTRQDELYDKIKTNMLLSSVSFMPLKGRVVRKYHPIPELRTMGDCDILIRKGDFKKACEALEKSGFEKTDTIGEEASFRRGRVFIDVHSSLCDDEKAPEYAFLEETRRFLLERGEVIPPAYFHFVYLLYHISKHVKDFGCGIRPYLDVALMVKNCNVDYDEAEYDLKRIGLYTFAEKTMALVSRWFWVSVPFQARIDEDFYERATDKTLSDGIFGRQNSENAVAFSTKMQGKTPLGTFFKRLFPPYSVIRRFSYCAFVNGRPYLLPIAWIWRLIRCLFVKDAKDVKQKLSEPFTSGEEIKKRSELLSQWGL